MLVNFSNLTQMNFIILRCKVSVESQEELQCVAVCAVDCFLLDLDQRSARDEEALLRKKA